jgi:hypothetical protein
MHPFSWLLFCILNVRIQEIKKPRRNLKNVEKPTKCYQTKAREKLMIDSARKD